jgi:hypothetical protein
MREKKLALASVLSLSRIREFAQRHLSDIAKGNDPFDRKAVMKVILTLSAFVNESYMPYICSHKRLWETDQILLRATHYHTGVICTWTRLPTAIRSS